MNLIFVYGPPAVGKRTVSLELARLTGYRLFDNHLTVPAVNAIFPGEKTPARSRLLKDLRLTSIRAAAQADVNLIFTAAYSGGPDDVAFIQEIADTVEATPGGCMMYAQLYTSLDVLLERVGGESRKALGLQKMVDPDEYRRRLEETGRDLMVSVVYKDVFMVDTTALSPKQAAQRIASHFQM